MINPFYKRYLLLKQRFSGRPRLSPWWLLRLPPEWPRSLLSWVLGSLQSMLRLSSQPWGRRFVRQLLYQLQFLVNGIILMLEKIGFFLLNFATALVKFLNQTGRWSWRVVREVSAAVTLDLEQLGLIAADNIRFLITDLKKIVKIWLWLITSFTGKIYQRFLQPSLEKIKYQVVRFVQKTYRSTCLKVKRLIYLAQEGRLSWFYLFKLAFNNLLYSKSRTLVTTGAIALGTGSIVFLVSFAYGLQEVVTNRLIYENATQIADVQSNSTALVLNQESVDEIKQIGGVKDVAVAISLAGKLSFNNSKTDVVVVGTQNNFLEYANMIPIAGTQFSQSANQTYLPDQSQISQLQSFIEQSQGDVLGAQDEPQIEIGGLIRDTTLRYRVKDDTYLPLREQPTQDAQILGYIRGSILKTYAGQPVWGSTFDSVDTKGKSYQDGAGRWYGEWLQTEVSLYQEKAPTVYEPLADVNGAQIKKEGYIPQTDIHILSPAEIMVEQDLEKVLEEGRTEDGADNVDSQERQPQVLGEATASAELAALTGTDAASNNAAAGTASSGNATTSAQTTTSDATTSAQTAATLNSQDATAAAGLRELVTGETEEDQAEEQLQNQFALVEVSKPDGKEIIVSTGLLDLWELNPQDVIGQTMQLEYILSGGVIRGLNGRVMSQAVTYQVAGVIDDEQTLIFAPLGDLQSLGASQYTTLKVLAKSRDLLEQVRTHIETLGFTTQSLVDTLAQVQKLFSVMRFLLGLFGMIALIVAVFGMFNTLTISLLERTREIGVMKTLGTTDGDVLKLFLVESFQIGILGGVLGIGLGVVLGTLVDLGFSLFKGGLFNGGGINLFQTPVSFMLFVFGLSVLVGLVTGLYPSNRARNISALDALRYE